MSSSRQPENNKHNFWQRWLARRLPASKNQTLSHKGIFILPTGFGMIWVLLTLLLFLFGTNYQNNLIIGLSLLMISIFTTCLILGYRNLAGLNLQSTPLPQVYAGETLGIPITLEAEHHCWQVNLSFTGNNVIEHARITNNPCKTLVPFAETQRGWLISGRLKVASSYPMGLCQAWSYLDMNIEHLVFANPVKPSNPSLYLSNKDTQCPEGGGYVQGVDEFQGLREYIQGESIKQIAWKQLAQGKGMLTKEFQQPKGATVWLSMPTTSEAFVEQHISALSYMIETYNKCQQIFGLALEGEQIFPDTGDHHRILCQQALAKIPKPSITNGRE